MNIFIAKLSSATTGDDLQELFEEYGNVDSAKVIYDKFTGNSKRFGFVEMDSDQDALDAIEELDGCEFDNSKIVVKKARPRDDNRNRNNYNRN
jgi:RNA recognition motif-containing protein